MRHALKMGQACKVAGVCRDTMRKWCQDGTVDAWTVPAGSRVDWRINPESLDALKHDPKILELARRAGL